MLNPVILAIPMFFTLMAIEVIYEAITNKHTYRLNDSITNISTGTLQQLTNTFKALIKVGIYSFLFYNFSLFQLEQNWLTFFYALAFWDFCYYWEHRMAHSVNLFWGGHVVHHQSENFNLSVALRQTSTGFIWGAILYLPMAVLGISPEQFVFAAGINLLYQFWIHTEHINKMPRWFEYLFNTPSHHRVHHGRDPKYIDKNYAGILMIWDRMFGTFKAEEERPNYGTTTPFGSWNPIYANFSHYIYVFKHVAKAKSIKDTVKILFKPPGWLPDYLGGYEAPPEVPSDYQKFDIPIAQGVNYYVFLQFLAAAVFNAYFFFQYTTFNIPTQCVYGLWIVITTMMFGFLFESKGRWLALIEIPRLLMIPFGVYAMIQMGHSFPTWSIFITAIFAVFSIFAFLWVQSYKQIPQPNVSTISTT